MTEKARDRIISVLTAILIVVIGYLWTMNYDYVKKVDAKCFDLQTKKAEKEEIKEVKEMLIRMDIKMDKLDEKIDELR